MVKGDTRCSKKERGTIDEGRGTKDERIYHPSEAVVRRLSAAVVCRVLSKRGSSIENRVLTNVNSF